MHGQVGPGTAVTPQFAGTTVRIASRADVTRLPRWSRAFAGERKDHRFYELLEDTLTDGFSYGYLVVESGGDVRAIQPCFIVDQDLLGGISGFGKRCFDTVRRVWPRFMRARTLMVGCSAGEGHLDAGDMPDTALAEALVGALPRLARELIASWSCSRNFPRAIAPPWRASRSPLHPRPQHADDQAHADPTRISTIMCAASSAPTTRATLRRKLRVCAARSRRSRIEVRHDARGIVDEIHPLYLNVFVRSPLQFEKLTREFLAEIGARMPDKTRLFVWRQDGRAVAFALCLVDGDDIYYEYVGFDYAVAFELHLYYRVFHDIIEWAIANGYREFLQRQPQLRSEMALAAVARSGRSLRTPHLGADQRSVPAPAAADRADSRRSNPAEF